MGIEVANALSGNDIVIIENDKEKVDILTQSVDALVIQGNATRMDILEQAGFDDADAVIALTDNDETNLLVAMLATKKGKKVVARVNEQSHVDMFKNAGIKSPVIPEKKAAEVIARKISEKSVDIRHVIIVGGGTLGIALANNLPEQIAILIEIDDKVCDSARKETGEGTLVVQGDATQMDVLERAGINKTDLVAAMTDNDQINLLVATQAMQKGKEVIARVKDSGHDRLFRELGVKNIVMPDKSAAIAIAKEIKEFGDKEK